METLPHLDELPHFPDPVVGSNAPMMYHNIVEISSDEEEEVDDGQPESSRAAYLSPNGKRNVIVDSDDEDLGTQLDYFYRFLGPAGNKRQKVDHINTVDETHQQLDPADFMDFTHSPLEQQNLDFGHFDTNFMKTDESFNALNTGDARTTLTIRPASRSETGKGTAHLESHRQSEHQRAKSEKETSQQDSRLKVPPYYYDFKLEAHMYCGPGFENFPIVLGYNSEHQDICDEWDRTEARRSICRYREKAPLPGLNHLVEDTSDALNEDEINRALEQTAVELECLQKVREVLPDVQRDFALNKIREHMRSSQENDIEKTYLQPNPALVLSHILESLEYPKQDKGRKVGEPAADGTGVTIDWRKGDVESKTYQRDAVCLLASQFEYVPTHYIYKTIQEQKTLFESYQHIHDLNMAYDNIASKERPYRRSTNPRQLLEKKYTSKGTEPRSIEQWESLVNELQAARQKVERDKLQKAKEEDQRIAEQVNLEEHKANGNIVECQCCFDDEIPINRAVSCESHDMHWFCFDCVLRLAENQVGSMKYEMVCMHQSGCKASLSKEGISSAIPGKLCDKLAFYQQQHEITAACIEGLEQCPFCDFKAICDPIEENLTFQCQNPDCGRVTCRKCHEDSHIPRSCEEFKSDKQISARHQVEEARSEAMMRSCPKCKVKIIKEVGCNKMVCGRCACVMCYVCREDISGHKDGGYNHFGKSGSKCTLHDQNFDRHEEEADEAEMAAIKKVQAEHADIDEKELQVETGKPKKQKIAALSPEDLLGVGLNQRRRLPPIVQPELPPVMLANPPQAKNHRVGQWLRDVAEFDRQGHGEQQPAHIPRVYPVVNNIAGKLGRRRDSDVAVGRNHEHLYHVFPVHQPNAVEPRGPIANNAPPNFTFLPIRPPNHAPLPMQGGLAHMAYNNNWAWDTNGVGPLGNETAPMMPMEYAHGLPGGRAHNGHGAPNHLQPQYAAGNEYMNNLFAPFDRFNMDLGIQGPGHGNHRN